MRLTLETSAKSFALHTPFAISRGAKTSAEVIEVRLSRGGSIGRGEGVPYARYGESIAGSLAEIEAVRDKLELGISREILLHAMAPGAARNALDAALWDLEAQEAATSVWELLQCSRPSGFHTAITISLDNPEIMFEAALKQTNTRIIKVKVGADDPMARIMAVHEAAPGARLIVDPNESWSFEQLVRLSPDLKAQGVVLVEQPLAADKDITLAGYSGPIPLAADESMHTIGDLPKVAARYQVVNLKLDKTGGLTAALQVEKAARAMGLRIMCGCMVSTSLSMAPALHFAARAEFVDLDGPISLTADRPSALTFSDGKIGLPSGRERGLLWGGL